MKSNKMALTLKTLNKSNVWELQENDVIRLWEEAYRDLDFRDNQLHYINVIKSAFEIDEIKNDLPEIIKKYEQRGYNTSLLKVADNAQNKLIIKKKSIQRITDLTYENIRHISVTKILEILEGNFGSGWESIPQSIKDIIERGFDISTTTLPKDRLHKKGGMYEKKKADGFEVLEIPKGLWVEAIFVKEKPEMNKLHLVINKSELLEDDNEEDEEMDENLTSYEDDCEEEENDDFNDDELTAECYHTTFDAEDEELDLTDAELESDEDY